MLGVVVLYCILFKDNWTTFLFLYPPNKVLYTHTKIRNAFWENHGRTDLSLLWSLYDLKILTFQVFRDHSLSASTISVPYNRVPASKLSQDEGQDMCSHTTICLWHRVMSPGTSSSGAVTPPVVLAPTSYLRAARVPPRVPWPQLLSPGLGQLGCCHAARGASSHLLAYGSSEATTCHMELYGLLK
jgi:hypothetical protein